MKKLTQQAHILASTITLLVSIDASAKGFEATYTHEAIQIDGQSKEAIWDKAKWYSMDYLMVGSQPTPEDFSGKFRLLWDLEKLYLQAEIVDDVLFDQHPNPLDFYWDDDCLEIFIDADHSGGEHTNNFNAFAYHVALDNQAVDIGELNSNGETNFLLLNDHLTSNWQRQEKAPHRIVWEVALSVYPDTYTHPNINNVKPITLKESQKMGFMLAYCDNDGSKNRESFMGSTDIKPVNGDKNLGYKTADVFETLTLKK